MTQVIASSGEIVVKNSHMFEAYQVLLPLGVLLGLVGIFLWPLLFLGVVSTYPGPLHISLQLYGFLLCSISGFLMTAFPRFCRLGPVNSSTIWAMTLLLIICHGLSFFDLRLSTHLMVLPIVFLSFFLFTKWWQRKIEPPQEFVMIPISLILGLISMYLRTNTPFGSASELFGRKLFVEGCVLGLVMGIGNRLFPLFFGFLSAEPKSFFKLSSIWKERIWINRGVFLFFVGSFVAEFLESVTFALVLRTLSVMLSIFGLCHIHRNPIRVTRLTLVFRIGLGFLGLSYFSRLFFPNNLEISHVLMIGTFSLLILGIATRIILSHGGYDLVVETKSIFLIVFLAGSVVALILRAINLWWVRVPVNISWSLASCVLGGVWCAWAVLYVPKALFPKEKVPYDKLK